MSSYRNLPKGVWALGLASLLTDVASEAVYPLLPIYFATVLSASPMAIGLIEGLAKTTAALLQPFSGAWSDKLGRAKPLVTGGYFLSHFGRGCLAFVQTWPQALFFRFLDRVGKGIRTAPRDAWLSRLAAKERLPHIYGFHRAMDHMGAVIGPLLAGVFLYFSPENYRGLILLSLIPGFLAVLCTVLPREPKFNPNPSRSLFQWREMPPSLKRFAAVSALFMMANASDAFLLLRLQQAGLATSLIPVAWGVLHLMKVLASLAAAPLVDKIGAVNMVRLGWIWYAVIYVGLGVFTHPPALFLVFCLYGIFHGMTEGPERTIVARLAPETGRGNAFGLFAIATGLAALPSSLLFGFLWGRFGHLTAFCFSATVALLASRLLGALTLKDRKVI